MVLMNVKMVVLIYVEDGGDSDGEEEEKTEL